LARKSLYSPHPTIPMVQKWIADLPTKTGRSLDEWLALIERDGPADQNARRDWLKSRHGMGTVNATWMAERSVGKGLEDSDPVLYLLAAEKYVAAMYANKRDLVSIYDALLQQCLALGSDVKACPCKTMVPLYRNHVFAQIKPSSRTRIDLGLALRDFSATGALIDTGGFAKKDRITHRIPITSLADINDEVRKWLEKAYILDAKA
jgi:hypothetical protein